VFGDRSGIVVAYVRGQLVDDFRPTIFGLLLRPCLPNPIGDEVGLWICPYPNFPGRRFNRLSFDKGGDLLRFNFERLDRVEDFDRRLPP